MTAIALALGASVLWGVGDFLGGVTSRRLATLTVLAYSQVAGLLGILIAALFLEDEFLSVIGFIAAVLAGIGGSSASELSTGGWLSVRSASSHRSPRRPR